jgi:uncharacterized Zn finger protein
MEMTDKQFTIRCNDCGNENVKPSLLESIDEIALNCGECGNQELFDNGLDYMDFMGDYLEE